MAQANADMARDLARLSTDCSFLLTHLVRQHHGRTDEEARAILGSILSIDQNPRTPLLRAGRVGWYSAVTANVIDPVTGDFRPSESTSSVCFTESTLAGLKAHRDVFSAKYGLAFDRDYLFGRGANPCLNIASSLLRKGVMRAGERYPRFVYNFIPPDLHPYVNIINEAFDATHEREWRYAADLLFDCGDVMFVFCPEADFARFAGVQAVGKPVLFDLAWLSRI
jgi:hypothetical protein